jgi:O-acetylserine/cysteine efflux transporter
MAPRDFSLFLLICLVWSLNTIMSAIVVSDMGVPPLFYAGLRFVVVLALLFPWIRGAPRPLWRLALVGFLMGGGNFGFIFVGLQTATATSAAIVNQLGAPITIGLSVLMLGEQLTGRRIIGMVLALAGALAVIWEPGGLVISTGLLWVVLGTFAASLGVILMKQVPAGVRPLQLQAWVALASLPPMGLGSLAFEHQQFEAALQGGWLFVGAVVFSALMVSIFAHTLFYDLLRRYEANIIAPLTLLNPVFTIILGVLITNDHFDARMAFGAAAALIGVLIIGVSPDAMAAALGRLRSRRP